MKPYAVAIVALMLVATVSICVPADADQQEGRLLVDYGNGSYVWLDDLGEGTLLEAAKHSLDSAGMEYELSADGKGFASINGVEEMTISSVNCA